MIVCHDLNELKAAIAATLEMPDFVQSLSQSRAFYCSRDILVAADTATVRLWTSNPDGTKQVHLRATLSWPMFSLESLVESTASIMSVFGDMSATSEWLPTKTGLLEKDGVSAFTQRYQRVEEVRAMHVMATNALNQYADRKNPNGPQAASSSQGTRFVGGIERDLTPKERVLKVAMSPKQQRALVFAQDAICALYDGEPFDLCADAHADACDDLEPIAAMCEGNFTTLQ